jgi:uncharacterized Fe-S cluster-containing MiaB family protein
MYITQYKNAIEQYDIRDVVCLYNEGSMLNDEELPLKELLFIITDLLVRGGKTISLRKPT